MDDQEIRYAKRGDLHVAYEVRGDGPVDLLAFGNGTTVWIDRDHEVHLRRFDQQLASFCRLIRFDPCGLGLSDPLASGETLSVEGWMRDGLAVLDAVGSTKAAVLGVGEAGLAAMLLSATCPERVAAQILVHCFARLTRDVDYPWGIPSPMADRFIASTVEPGYDGPPVDDLALMAPSLADDAEFRTWWRLAGQRGASPATARAFSLLAVTADVRSVLPLITVPTLVLHREGNDYVRMGHARYLADNIPGAKLVELPGVDHLAFVGDTFTLLGEVEELLTGARATSSTDRVLASILFTDIVGSTTRAVEAGDRHWRELLDSHDLMADRQVHRFAGRRVRLTGDGILATFDGPARAVQCGLAICDAARQLGLEVRVGVHAGEIELRGEDIAGVSVHVAARIEAAASTGEVWVSRTITDLVAGSGLRFAARGEHELKGLPGTWQLFAVET